MADEKEVKAKPAKQAKAPKKAEAAEKPAGKVAKLPEGLRAAPASSTTTRLCAPS
jgi:hypothetical protein